MDTTRFDELYREHAPGLVRFAQWLCGNRHDAEDLAAEAFVRAFAGAALHRHQEARAAGDVARGAPGRLGEDGLDQDAGARGPGEVAADADDQRRRHSVIHRPDLLSHRA